MQADRQSGSIAVCPPVSLAARLPVRLAGMLPGGLAREQMWLALGGAAYYLNLAYGALVIGQGLGHKLGC